jgi:serine protease Do
MSPAQCSTPVALRQAVAVCALLVIGASPALAQRSPANIAALGDLSRSLQELSQKVSASVVQIFVTGYGAPDADDPRGALPVFEHSSGSGVIVDADGYVVTNAHVIESATRIEVELPLAATGGDPGRSILGRRGRTLGAQIVAIDRETDIAVLKIEARALPVLTFGDSDSLRPGQIVLALGSPRGLDSSVTMGIVSAVARQLKPEDPMIYIQTDAPINPGNSGGALVDTEGRLVGVNTLIYSESGGNEGIGFAAPSNIVRNVFQQIRKTGRVRRGEIGVTTQTITSVLAEALQLPVDTGVIISDVEEGGPAARAGLQPGDVVQTLDGKRMENGRQFRINIYTRAIGDQVTVEVQRGERRLTVRVPVAERESGTARLTDLLAPQNNIRLLGVFVLELTPQIHQILHSARRQKGVVVASVSPETPYSQQGRLQAGDVIYSLNGTTITSVADLRAATDSLKPATAAVLQIERDGGLMYLAFRMEAR